MLYSPDVFTVIVRMNATVTWINHDTVQHTVTATDNKLRFGNYCLREIMEPHLLAARNLSLLLHLPRWLYEGEVIVLAIH
jgi:plastocyanin